MKEFESIYVEIGKLLLEYESMNLSIRSCIRHIEKIETKDGYDKILDTPASSLYKKFRKVLRKAKYELSYIKDLDTRIKEIQKERNNIVHSYALIGCVEINSYNVNGVTKSELTPPSATFFNKESNQNYTIEDFKKLNSKCNKLHFDIFNLSNEIDKNYPLKLYSTPEEYEVWLNTKDKVGILEKPRKKIKKTLRKLVEKI